MQALVAIGISILIVLFILAFLLLQSNYLQQLNSIYLNTIKESLLRLEERVSKGPAPSVDELCRQFRIELEQSQRRK
jgi:hypothetical protein